MRRTVVSYLGFTHAFLFFFIDAERRRNPTKRFPAKRVIDASSKQQSSKFVGVTLKVTHGNFINFSSCVCKVAK